MATKFKLNPVQGELDLIQNEDDLAFLPYDGDKSFVYFKENGNTLELWWKSVLVHEWTAVPAPPPVGSPMGLALLITYPA
jgi:hypothetical protein